jgi:hypothetical protein
MSNENRTANLTQLKVSGTLVTNNNYFPILLPEDIRGSIRHVEDHDELSSISSVFLDVGQLAYVRNSIENYPSGYYYIEHLNESTPAARLDDGSLSNYKWSRFGLSTSSIVKTVPFTNQSTITVAHNFGYNPTIVIIDSEGSEIEGQITHTNINTSQVNFNVQKTGTVTLK